MTLPRRTLPQEARHKLRGTENGILVLAEFAVPATAADYDAGLAAFESARYELALKAWQPLADSGDPCAQWGLGMMYANGLGVEMNDAEALKWFELSAAQGYADAQYRLGVMQRKGWGLPMDDVAAAAWFEKAAEQGHTEAQVALGGLGTDIPDTFEWAHRAMRGVRWQDKSIPKSTSRKLWL